VTAVERPRGEHDVVPGEPALRAAGEPGVTLPTIAGSCGAMPTNPMGPKSVFIRSGVMIVVRRTPPRMNSTRSGVLA